VHLYQLENKNGLKAYITNFGGRLVRLFVPDKSGKMIDALQGFNTVSDYQNSTESYFGATIGCYGNRIAKGKFKLNGKEYMLFINNYPNTLHGGKKGKLTAISIDGTSNVGGKIFIDDVKTA
jgi:aldose 1-epimerase